MNTANYVSGKCDKLCPPNERTLRIKKNFLHFYELKDGQKDVPGTLIKSFAHAAAGAKAPKPHNLRTGQCLERCIEYLLRDILTDKRKPFECAYEFIFDRFRAVRKEIMIQNFDAQQSIKLLEPIVTFLAYSRYRLCDKPISVFNSKICDQYLRDCLEHLLCCYDTIDMKKVNAKELRNRIFIEALYQVLNLDSVEALTRSTKLPMCIRLDATFKLAFSIALNHYKGNLYRVLNGISGLPHILCAVASLKIQTIRRQLLRVFAFSYNCKKYPVAAHYLCELTLHRNLQELSKDCAYYNFKTYEGFVGFSKKALKENLQTIPAKREHFVEEKLWRINLPEVLLLKNL